MGRRITPRRSFEACSSTRQPRFRSPRFESLEPRELLAVTATFSAGVASFIGDGQNDTLELFVQAGILHYTGATPASATLNIAVSNLTALVIDLGGGNDAVRFRGETPLSLAQGRLAVSNAETTRIDTSIFTLGDLDLHSGNVQIGAGSIALAASEDVYVTATVSSAVISALPVPIDGGTLLAWQRSLGKTTGALLSEGDLDGDGNIDRNDLALIRKEFGNLYTGHSELIVAAGGVAHFTSTLISLDGLTVDAVQTILGVNSLTIDAPGVLFNGPVVLAASSTIDSFGPVTFNSTVDGAHALTVNSAKGADTRFLSQVGDVVPLQSLATNADGRTLLGANVSTTSDQFYGDAVLLTGDATLIGDDIIFNSTLDGAFDLTVTADGQIMFVGVVGGIIPLASLTTNGGGAASVGRDLLATSGDRASRSAAVDALFAAGDFTTAFAAQPARRPAPRARLRV